MSWLTELISRETLGAISLGMAAVPGTGNIDSPVPPAQRAWASPDSGTEKPYT